MSAHFLDGAEVSHRHFMIHQCHLVTYALSPLLDASERLSERIKTVQTARDGSISQSDTKSAEDSFQEEVAALQLLKERIDAVIGHIYSLASLLPKTAFLCPEQRSLSQNEGSEGSRSGLCGEIREVFWVRHHR